jgi:hypothetical protein
MKPCGYRQLCAIATDLLKRDPSLLMHQVEWKESIKDRATALGYPRPWSEDVRKVMDAVEFVHQKMQRSNTHS